jgi:hypothetical protein
MLSFVPGTLDGVPHDPVAHHRVAQFGQVDSAVRPPSGDSARPTPVAKLPVGHGGPVAPVAVAARVLGWNSEAAFVGHAAARLYPRPLSAEELCLLGSKLLLGQDALIAR